MRRVLCACSKPVIISPTPITVRSICWGSSRSRKREQQRQRQRRTLLTRKGRNAAVGGLFQHLESKYGNLPSLVDTGPPSETIFSGDGVIHLENLVRLFRHEATALHVSNFFHRKSAERLGDELVRESQHGGGGDNWKVSTSRGLESSDVGTLGEHCPYNVAAARDQRGGGGGGAGSHVDEYFEGVLREFRSRRRRPRSADAGVGGEGGPDHYRLWPLDKLRLELEEAWPRGAGLAREDAGQRRRDGGARRDHPRPFGGGLPRIMRGPTRWRRGFVHVDEMGPLDSARGLFSANIYLTMPGEQRKDKASDGSDAIGSGRDGGSGELHVWPLGVRSRWDWYRNAVTLSSLSSQDPEMQLNLRHVLGKPNVIIPKPGDLVLLCAQRPHCAVGFESGVRVSLQCFLQYEGLENRLLIDC